MSVAVPEAALRFGFENNPVGTHGSRTLMLADLRLLLAACPPEASIDAYRSAIVDQNVLLKPTVVTRRDSFRRLRELYALNNTTLLFHALRDLWESETQAQPLLALLCATAVLLCWLRLGEQMMRKPAPRLPAVNGSISRSLPVPSARQ